MEKQQILLVLFTSHPLLGFLIYMSIKPVNYISCTLWRSSELDKDGHIKDRFTSLLSMQYWKKRKKKKSLQNYARIFLIFAAGSEIQDLNPLTHTDKKKINCHNLAADVPHLKVTAAPKERLGSFFNGCLGQTLHAFQSQIWRCSALF